MPIPIFFVEHISGWRDVKARMPTYLQIPEMAKRSFEYILEFDVLTREVERQSLIQAENKIRQRWMIELESSKRQFHGTGVMFEGISDGPAANWPPTCQCRPGSRPHCRPVTMVADNV